jgi:hypothetical protein
VVIPSQILCGHESDVSYRRNSERRVGQAPPSGKREGREETVAILAIEATDYPQIEGGREFRSHSQRPGRKTWDGSFQHQCVVPHDRKKVKEIKKVAPGRFAWTVSSER